jgi:ribonuclease Z
MVRGGAEAQQSGCLIRAGRVSVPGHPPGGRAAAVRRLPQKPCAQGRFAFRDPARPLRPPYGEGLMRSTLEPRFVDPSANEPGLVVDVRDERRSLLFDLGDIVRLPPRVLLRVSHAFVTHTHMDHFSGFDQLLAVGLGRLPRLVLWGGPGFVEQLQHKLRAYTWNVVHRYEQPLVIEVHALEADGSRRHARFDSRERFALAGLAEEPPREGGLLLDEPLFAVRATIVDHEMPVLAFAIEEKARLRVAADRIAALGLAAGAWLRTLKLAVLSGAPDDAPIDGVLRRGTGAPPQPERRRLGELRPLVLDTLPGRRIGYVTDLRYTQSNIEQLQRLLTDVDLLFIESVFRDADRDHAARKNHLTTAQAGDIARRLRARAVQPFHFSPRYLGSEQVLQDEVRAAWRGTNLAE